MDFWNAHIHCGDLYLIYFEDVNLGYPVQDVAVTLSCGREREGYEAWKDAFEGGYCSVRPWPAENERTVETLVAARNVMFINYVARIDPSPLEYIERRSAGLAHYLDAYG